MPGRHWWERRGLLATGITAHSILLAASTEGEKVYGQAAENLTLFTFPGLERAE